MAFARSVAVTVTHTKTLIAPDSGSADLVYGSDYVSPTSHTGTGTETVSGATSGGIPYFDSATSEKSSGVLIAGRIVLGGGAGAAPNDSANLTYSDTLSQSGPGLQVGVGAVGSCGWLIGHGWTNGLSAIWNTAVTAATDNWTLASLSGNAYINGTAGVILNISGTPRFQFTSTAGSMQLEASLAAPANGSTAARVSLGSTVGFGIYFGSGNPSVSAAQGSIYLKTDGSGIADRLWVNTNGSTGWTNFVSAA